MNGNLFSSLKMFPYGVVQIAGVVDELELKMLLECGVSFIGFPLRLAYHREDLPEEVTRKLILKYAHRFTPVLITYEEDPKEFVSLVRFLGVQYVQLHAPVDPMVLESIRKLAPDLILIKSLIIGRYSWETLLDYARECEILSDAFLTDTFDPKTTAMGATGKTHDWSISARLRNVLKKPLILAGGLTPFNLQMAIEAVHPWGVDVHTGVEDCTGRKVKLLVQQFLHVSQQVFKTIPPYL